MIGEHLFGFDSFDIDPLSEGAKDRLYQAVHEKRREFKNSRAARRKEILVGQVWSRGDNYYFDIYPTDLTEDAATPPTLL